MYFKVLLFLLAPPVAQIQTSLYQVPMKGGILWKELARKAPLMLNSGSINGMMIDDASFFCVECRSRSPCNHSQH